MNSFTPKYGGFIYANFNNSIKIINSTFINITGNKGGGLIYLFSNNHLILAEVKIGNTST